MSDVLRPPAWAWPGARGRPRPAPVRPGGDWTAASVLLGLAALTSSWVTVRNEGTLVADYFIVAALATGIIAGLGRRRALGHGTAHLPLAAIALITVGGILGPILTGRAQIGDAVAGAIPFVLSTALSLVAAQVAITGRRQLERVGRMFVGGVVISAAFGLVGGADAAGRIGGLGGHPNHVGLTCMLALALVGFAPDLFPPWVRIGCGALLAVALVQTGSRAALVGTAVVVVVGIALSPTGLGAKARVVVLLGLVALALLAAFPQTFEASGFRRLRGEQTAGSDEARAEKLEAASSEILASPLFGRGLAGSRTTHSVPVQVWAASGLFGLLGLVALARFAQVGIRRVRRRQVPLGAALAAGLVGLGTALAVANQFWDRYIWLIVALFTVALGIGRREARARSAGAPTPAAR